MKGRHEPPGKGIKTLFFFLRLRYRLPLDAARRSLVRTRADRAHPARPLLLEAETQVVPIRCVHARPQTPRCPQSPGAGPPNRVPTHRESDSHHRGPRAFLRSYSRRFLISITRPLFPFTGKALRNCAGPIFIFFLSHSKVNGTGSLVKCSTQTG